MITSEDIVACIWEGNSEKYIITLLLEQEALIFTKEQLLDDKFLQGKYRNPENFSNQYLTMDYEGSQIVVLSIQDNKKTYSLKNPYSNKVKEVYLVVTAPEIEMLMIHSLNCYSEYQKVKTNKKPSIFLAERLKEKASKIKSQTFINHFYAEHSLKDAIITHQSKVKKDSRIIPLAELLK